MRDEGVAWVISFSAEQNAERGRKSAVGTGVSLA